MDIVGHMAIKLPKIITATLAAVAPKDTRLTLPGLILWEEVTKIRIGNHSPDS